MNGLVWRCGVRGVRGDGVGGGCASGGVPGDVWERKREEREKESGEEVGKHREIRSFGIIVAVHCGGVECMSARMVLFK